MIARTARPAEVTAHKATSTQLLPDGVSQEWRVLRFIPEKSSSNLIQAGEKHIEVRKDLRRKSPYVTIKRLHVFFLHRTVRDMFSHLRPSGIRWPRRRKLL